MRNALILGSGRSGTSMVAGALAKAGYFMGDSLVPAREANPKGFFEDVDINMINEDLIAQIVPSRLVVMGKEFFRSRPLEGQRWLASVPVGARIPCPRHMVARMRAVTRYEPFCFKDPRFCYTLPAWRSFLNNPAFVCVFRDPASTALSIVKECKEASYLHTLAMTFRRALKVWRLMYSHVLRIHRHEGDWLFLHYDQVLGRDGLHRLQGFVEAPVDHAFPDASLRRSVSLHSVPRNIGRIYVELCKLAGYEQYSERQGQIRGYSLNT